jgi:hypothetical protein
MSWSSFITFNVDYLNHPYIQIECKIKIVKFGEMGNGKMFKLFKKYT